MTKYFQSFIGGSCHNLYVYKLAMVVICIPLKFRYDIVGIDYIDSKYK